MIRQATVYIVDDDAAVRDGISLQLEAAGFKVKNFAGARDFLETIHPQDPGCLLLDVRMPQMNGPELQKELTRRNISLPIIFFTGYGDIPLAVKTIQAGAVNFLTKPVNRPLLLESVRSALDLNARQQLIDAENDRLARNLDTLTKREREVLNYAMEGCPNKSIAKQLGISSRTVEHYRSSILLKTGAANLLELARRVDSIRNA